MTNMLQKYFKLLAILAIFLACLPNYADAQALKTLEVKRKALQEQIAILGKSLEKTLKDKNRRSQSLSTLSLQIKTREQLLSTLNQQIALLQAQIVQRSAEIEQLQEQVKIMKIDYAQTIQYSQYSLNLLNKISFILSSKDANQLYKRIKYFSQLASYIRLKAKQISKNTQQTIAKLQETSQQIQDKKRLLDSKNKEKVSLDKAWKQQNLMVKQLNQQEQTLRLDLQRKRKEQDLLNKSIQIAIKKELQREAERRRIAKQKSARKSGQSPPKGSSDSLNSKHLSYKFLENKGRLPWPVSFGHIVEQFGTHPHPSLRKVTTYNIGINIKTLAASKVTSVFSGKVLAVQLLYGSYAVIVQHGTYFTTYANLGSVTVKNGDLVKVGQQLGLAKSSADGLTEIHFIVTEGTVNLNPEAWLAMK